MSLNYNVKIISLTISAAMLPALNSPFYAQEIQSSEKISPSKSYWLNSVIPDEGLCGNKMQPNIPVITKEAENGNYFAAFRLGQLYRSGRWGVIQNLNTARYWFEIAAKGGQRSAQIIMGQAYEFGRLMLQPDTELAIAYYKMANKLKFESDINNRIAQLENNIRTP